MSLERIERTSLWKSSLAFQKKDDYERERESLRVAYKKFREKAAYLVAHIASSIPGLTVHDITHLDALWETASLIAGKSYDLNAFEGFVLGGAILLHDSALCYEAYDNGLEGLRNTLVWKDAYAALEDDQRQSLEEKLHNADFTALRILHADQAAKLVDKSWTDKSTGHGIYLIEDEVLRKHLGEVIGEIAASHHWDIEKVASKFPSQINALAGYPREWRIDPVKIACLLRCADAAHIDNERAPDFLHALRNRQGLSLLHWQAQNKLASVDVDHTDHTSLLFTSTRSYTEKEAAAWWIAYDAACLVDKEIRASNALLDNRQNAIAKSFQIKKVRGVESPELMANLIKVDGWSPCSAEIHVSNIARLVERLGGEQLYGRYGAYNFRIVLRELIQNARDAIWARKALEANFEGKIIVKVFKQDDDHWLIVEDNGVGMSERVLTGPLLDFGTSFWTSSLVQSEHKGLRSSKFTSIGRFGIGFYSVFMAAKEVYVASRSWKEGLDDVRQLQFTNGLSLRPLLKRKKPDDFSSAISTQVKLRLKVSPSAALTSHNSVPNGSELPVTDTALKYTIQEVCIGLDQSVYIVNSEGGEIKAHQNVLDKNFDVAEWIKNRTEFRFDGVLILARFLDRIRPIVEEGKLVGLAAISPLNPKRGGSGLGALTVGGFEAGTYSDGFVGYIDCHPSSAKREAHGYNYDQFPNEYLASKKTLKKWGEEQLQLLLAQSLTAEERYFAAVNLAQFEVVTTQLAYVKMHFGGAQHYITIPNLVVLAEKAKVLFLFAVGNNRMASLKDIIPDTGLESLVLVGLDSPTKFSVIEMDVNGPKFDYSLIGCVNQQILDNNKKPVWSTISTQLVSRYKYSVWALSLSVE